MRVVAPFIGHLSALALCAASLHAQQSDSVQVLRVTPEGRWQRGVAVDAQVQCRVLLASLDSASVAVGFSGADPLRYRMVASALVRRGWQTVTLRARVTPSATTGPGAPVGYVVNIRPLPVPTTAGARSRGIATARGKIEVMP